MIDPIKVTLYLDSNHGHLCPVCKGLCTRDVSRLAFILTPTEENLKRFGNKLLDPKNVKVVDSLNCKWSFESKTTYRERLEMKNELLNR